MATNTVVEEGNLTRDPELKITPKGTSLASFGLAVNRRWQNRTTQEWEEQVSFFDVTCWGQLADNVAESLFKGAGVVVVGRLDQQTWENDQGEKRSKVAITADVVGPSLRYATCEVTKNEKRGPAAEGDQAPDPGDPFG